MAHAARLGAASGWVLLASVGCADPAPRHHRKGGDDLSTELTADTGDGRLRFGLPVPDATRISAKVGVDHDPTVQTTGFDSTICSDYLGRAFPYCYDQHDGSDFILDGGFDAMDAGSMEILAAQDGVVIDAHDGEYDRCHIEGGTVSCDGYAMIGNQVTLEHADGTVTKYWHMKRGTVAVAIGDEVTCGQVLGLIGSSGYSSMPHVHFELLGPDGVVVDPFAGPYSQEQSYWDEQFPDPILPGPGCTAP